MLTIIIEWNSNRKNYENSEWVDGWVIEQIRPEL